METTELVQAPLLKRASVTIPAFASTASTLSTLATLTADEQSRVIAVKVCAQDTAGSDRAAFIAGDSTASLPQYVPSATAYQEPVIRDALNTYVKAASGAAIANVCVLFYLTAAAR